MISVLNDLNRTGEKHNIAIINNSMEVYRYILVKIICVDQSKTLITSANLSYHGQEGNIEMGTYIESATIARQVDEVFTKLLFSKVFLEYM